MLNPDFKDMLSGLSDWGVEFLLVGAYAMAAVGSTFAGSIIMIVGASDG